MVCHPALSLRFARRLQLPDRALVMEPCCKKGTRIRTAQTPTISQPTHQRFATTKTIAYPTHRLTPLAAKSKASREIPMPPLFFRQPTPRTKWPRARRTRAGANTCKYGVNYGSLHDLRWRAKWHNQIQEKSRRTIFSLLASLSKRTGIVKPDRNFCSCRREAAEKAEKSARKVVRYLHTVLLLSEHALICTQVTLLH